MLTEKRLTNHINFEISELESLTKIIQLIQNYLYKFKKI